MRVYYFENVSYFYKGWDAVFKSVVEYLKENYNAEIIHKTNYPGPGGTYFYIEEFKYDMPDCELLIYDEEKDILKIVSFSEAWTRSWDVLTERNNKNDLILLPQLYDWFNKDIETGEDRIDFSKFNFQIGSTVFYTLSQETDYEALYEKRKAKDFSELEDKMFMLFTTERLDPFKLSKLGYLNEDLTPVGIDDYFKKLINYKIGLSINTVAEHCYRDIEYMAVGVPFLRLEYIRDFNPPLIPNYHYIAVERKKYKLPYNTGLNRIGGDDHVKAYIERFLEVKDDKEFLNFVANNAREYYLNYCSPQNRLRHLLNLLNID